MKPKRNTPSYIIIKKIKVKNKEKLLKAEGEKQFVKYKGKPIKLPADFSAEIFTGQKGMTCHIQH